jgi:hypothetical protein
MEGDETIQHSEESYQQKNKTLFVQQTVSPPQDKIASVNNTMSCGTPSGPGSISSRLVRYLILLDVKSQKNFSFFLQIWKLCLPSGAPQLLPLRSLQQHGSRIGFSDFLPDRSRTRASVFCGTHRFGPVLFRAARAKESHETIQVLFTWRTALQRRHQLHHGVVEKFVCLSTLKKPVIKEKDSTTTTTKKKKKKR